MFQPAPGVFYFEAAMVYIGFWPQADFFNFYFGLGFASLAFFFIELENIFAQIKNFYDRWVCVRCDFDQVEIGISGDLPGFLNGYDTTVFPIGVN